jgi:cytochrome b561
MRTKPEKHSAWAKGLHWVVAFLIMGAFPLGLYMHDLPLTPDKLRLYSYHKWLGVTIALFAAIRLVRRAIAGAPAISLPGRPWELAAATAAHGLLYVLILLVPVSGWLMSSAEGFQTVWLGVLPLPDLIERDRDLATLLRTIHKNLNFLMAATVALHVLAALKHHFLARDDVLKGMLPQSMARRLP